MRVGQTRLNLFGDEPDEDAPQIYIASPLTHIADEAEARRLVESEIEHISRAVDEATRQAVPSWPVRLHAPILWTAPWNPGDGRSPEVLYMANRRLVVTDTDAMIIHGYGGGSMGVGQEFVWAQELGLPMLYVHHKDEPVSRQVRGTPALLTVAPFTDAAELCDVTRTFLRDNRTLIEQGPARRRNRQLRFHRPQATLHKAWHSLAELDQRRTAATVGISPAQASAIVEHPLETGSSPVHILTAFAAALGVDIAELLAGAPLPNLHIGQMRALIAAAEEQAWDDSNVERLTKRGRLELARSAVRRFRLNTPDDWLRLHNAL